MSYIRANLTHRLISPLWIFLFLLAGCAANPLKILLDGGKYADAYHYAALRSQDDRIDTAETIRSTLGQNTNSILSNQLKTRLSTQIRPEKYYVENFQLLEWARTDNLVSDVQHKELISMLTTTLLADGALNPSLLSAPDIASRFKIDPSSRLQLLTDKLDQSDQLESLSLGELLTMHISFRETNNRKLAEAIAPKLKQKALKGLREHLPPTPSHLDLKQYLAVLQNFEDAEIRNELEKLIVIAKLSPKDLQDDESLIPRVFSSLAMTEFERRTIPVNIEYVGDEFLAADIERELVNINEWIRQTPTLQKRIKVSRFRVVEKSTQPIVRTELVRDPSFVTLLGIPKNASVMYDYTIVDTALQWTLSVLTLPDRKTKEYSGQLKNRLVECSNFRFQNVFGGVGALSTPPNDRVNNFCLANKGTTESIHRQAINLMANSIYQNHILSK